MTQGKQSESCVLSSVWRARGSAWKYLTSLATAQMPRCALFLDSVLPCVWLSKGYVYLLYFHSFGCMEMCFQMTFFCDKIAVLELNWEPKTEKQTKNKSLYDVPLIVS